VFLLNKDIEALMARAGLKVLDIRHTLPNLMYLLYVLAAGKGELPARKAGGIRGLVVGSHEGSRRGSDASAGETPAMRNGRGKGKGEGLNVEEAKEPPIVRASEREEMSLRTRALRERA
jgi:hypothetical protein